MDRRKSFLIALIAVIAFVGLEHNYCSADSNTDVKTCKNLIRNATKALNKAQNAFDKCERNIATAEQRLDRTQTTLDNFHVKAEEKQAKKVEKLEVACEKSSERYATTKADYEYKIAELEAKIRQLSEQEDDSKKCVGLIDIGDACATDETYRIRNKRHKEEAKLSATIGRSEARLAILSRKMDTACSLAANPPETDNSTKIASLTRSRDKAASRLREFQTQLVGQTAILSQKQDEYDSAVNQCAGVV